MDLKRLQGFGAAVPTNPAIIYHDNFDQGDWQDGNGWDYEGVRCGNRSLVVNVSAGSAIYKNLPGILNFSGVEGMLQIYLKTPMSDGSDWDPFISIVLAESYNAFTAGNYCQCFANYVPWSVATAEPHWPATFSFILDNNSNTTVYGSGSLANVGMIYLQISNPASSSGYSGVFVMDHMTIVQRSATSQFHMRIDNNDWNLTNACLNYVNTLGLGIKIGVAVGYTISPQVVFTGMLAQQVNGHYPLNYMTSWGDMVCNADNPLTANSRLGALQITNYMFGGVGFMPYSIGILLPGSETYYDPDLGAMLEPYTKGYCQALTPVITGCYDNSQFIEIDDANDTYVSAVATLISNNIACHGRLGLFSHLSDITTLTNWIGSTAALAAFGSSYGGISTPTGVTGIFDPAGPLCTALRTGVSKWVSLPQFLNSSIGSSNNVNFFGSD